MSAPAGNRDAAPAASGGEPGRIEAVGLTLVAGTFALGELTFTVPGGSYAVLMGRTGSGKTTLLEAICGLNRPRSGRLILSGRDVTTLSPAARHIGFVPQDAVLFPTLTVAEHLAYALRVRRWGRSAREARVGELAESLGLGHLLARRPEGLSGGERQRVALGRALAFRPEILCLDEPLSALDDQTRAGLIDLLRRVHARTGVTVLHVTHHRAEADALASVRLDLADGRLTVQAAGGEGAGG